MYFVSLRLASNMRFFCFPGHGVIVMLASWLIGPIYNFLTVVPTSIVAPDGSCLVMAKWPSTGKISLLFEKQLKIKIDRSLVTDNVFSRLKIQVKQHDTFLGS